MKKILSMFLALCMVVTLLPVTAMAEEIHTPIGTSGEITSFAPLTEAEKTVSLGTSSENLELPETLTAAVRTALPPAEDSVQDSGSPETATPTTAAEPEWEETTRDIPVTWTSEPEYDMAAEGEYVFTPVIEGYDVRAELPEITVTVGELPPIAAAHGLAGTLPATTYDIWVGGVQVTDINKGDVLGAADGEGATVIYDNNTNTLTLNGATITNVYNTTIDIRDAQCGIYSEISNLKLVVAGTNSISSVSTVSNRSYAIYTTGKLDISESGNGSLTAESDNKTLGYGIYSGGKLTISSGTITGTSKSSGVAYSIGIDGQSIEILGGDVTATATGASDATTPIGIRSSTGIIIAGGKVTAKGEKTIANDLNSWGIKGNVVVTGGTVTAQGAKQALDGSLKTSGYTGCIVTASTDENGTSAVTYDAVNLASYKYIKVEPFSGASEQFTLAPGGTYYFDLSGEKDNIGTVNTALPDTTLHYVPFTYAGTVNAYSLPIAMVTTEEYASANKSDRSLFVGDYVIGTNVSWDSLNTASLIFGKPFDTNYTLRSLSAGSSKTGSASNGSDHVGQPNTNEWDQILYKSGSIENVAGWIKHWNEKSSWGQDTFESDPYSRVRRGYSGARRWLYSDSDYGNVDIGFRPALEVLNPGALGDDGLKAVTLNLNDGKLKDSTANINIICAGDVFKAPSGAGLTAPDGKTFAGWKDSGGTTYAADATVPNTVTGLTAQWTASDTTAPVVSSVTVPANDTYLPGNNLDFTVNFDESVIVDTTNGLPYIALTIGSTSQHATYVSGSGTSSLTFRYTVQAGDSDSDGVSVGALTLNGGIIQDAAGNNANLMLKSVGNTNGVLVDTSVPPPITVQPSDLEVTEGQSATFSVAAVGTDLTYQWQVNAGLGFADILDGILYSGATTAMLTITGATAGMNGYQYRAVVSDTVAPAATSNSATLTVTAAPSYTITASPTSKDFGSLAVGYSAPAAQTVTITNTGNSSVTLTQPTSTNYTIGALSTTTLAAGDTATFTVAPKTGLSVGNYAETLTVSTNHSTNATVELSFAVTTVPTYTITASPISKHFGSLAVGYTAPAAQTVTIRNTGNSSVTLTPPTSTNYTIGTLSDTTLAAGGTATFTVAPKVGLAVGNYAEALTVSTDHSTSTTVNFIFTVTAAPTYTITANPTTKDFGSLSVGYSAPAAQTVTITNTGNSSVTLTQPSSTNYTIGALSDTTLAAGGTATFTVTPKAGLAVGNYNETLTVSTDRSTNATVDLSFSVTAVPTYTITANPTSKDFGSLTVGYSAPAAQTVTITNTGNSSVTLTQPTSTNHTIGALSTTTLAAGGTATFTVTPKTGLAVGNYNETLTVSTDRSTNATVDLSFSVTAAPTHTVTFNPNGGTVGETSRSVASGTAVGTLPIPTRSGSYSFDGWYTAASGGTQISASTTVNATVSYYAHWTYTGGGGSGSGGGSSSNDNSSPVIVTPPAPDKPNSPTQGEIKVSGTVDSKGNVTVNITGKTVTDAFEKALADAKKSGNEQNGITVVLHVDTGSKTASNVTVNLPKTVQDTIIEKKIVNTLVVVDNPDIRIGMDLMTVQEINKQAKSDVNITATRGDSSKLTGDAKKAIGSRPVFDFKVNYGNGKEVSSFGAGSVSVTIPYTLGANEKAGNVQAVYVDSKGKVHWLTNSAYDSVEKVLHFSTDHFSTYGIGYKQTNTAFTDIAGHWAKGDIEFVVSRGLFSGTSNTTFSPNTAMTRGMFVTALGRLANADVSGYAKSSFNDVKDDAYYMGYIEWASKNNIVNGVGNGRFVPDQSITREQMAVIMSNYAKTIGYTLPKVHIENIFTDNAKINTYAKEAVKQMQMAGVISGKNSNLFDPQGTATRAEVSAVLRRFVELAISSDTAQGWSMNDSGKWMYFKDGKPLIGKQDIDGATYAFDQYGVTADVPKNLRYTTYTVQKGDSFWSISRKLGCPMSELERLNNKSRFSLIHPGDVLRVPEK